MLVIDRLKIAQLTAVGFLARKGHIEAKFSLKLLMIQYEISGNNFNDELAAKLRDFKQ